VCLWTRSCGHKNGVSRISKEETDNELGSFLDMDSLFFSFLLGVIAGDGFRSCTLESCPFSPGDVGPEVRECMVASWLVGWWVPHKVSRCIASHVLCGKSWLGEVWGEGGREWSDGMLTFTSFLFFLLLPHTTRKESFLHPIPSLPVPFRSFLGSQESTPKQSELTCVSSTWVLRALLVCGFSFSFGGPYCRRCASTWKLAS